MRAIDLAFEDIKIAIQSDIVHKYLLSNAPDMIAVANLAKVCTTYDKHLFAWAAAFSHAMVNPRVIDEIATLIKKHNGDKQLILEQITHPDTRSRWNTPEFHAEMKAVASDYQKHGGFLLGDINAGVAALFLHPDCANQVNELVRFVSDWLHSEEPVKEDDLIQAIFNLRIPGMHHETDKENGYWLLHFCRWISFVRDTVLHLPIIESTRYFDMIGVRIFRNHYTDLTLSDMPELFERCKVFIAQFEMQHGRPSPRITYGDFGCLACETHRMLDQLSKELKCPEDDARQMLRQRLQGADDLSGWLRFKETHTDYNQAPSILNSARYNSALFAQACQRQRPRSASDENACGATPGAAARM